MDDQSFNIRVPKKWVRMGMVAVVTALIVAPLTAIAAHTFTDVPDTNTFHEDIAWLKDAGVTLGCNPPANTLFCPKDEVTREQMSAFMRRLAENQVVDAATAIQAENATTADSATTAASADDASMVDGRSVGCDAGQTEFAGECWETNARGAVTSVFDAADACGDDGGRLPAVLELRRFGQISSITSPANEWSSTVFYDGAFRGYRLNGNTLVDSGTLDNGPYRCVFPFVETVPTPASASQDSPAEDGS